MFKYYPSSINSIYKFPLYKKNNNLWNINCRERLKILDGVVVFIMKKNK